MGSSRSASDALVSTGWAAALRVGVVALCVVVQAAAAQEASADPETPATEEALLASEDLFSDDFALEFEDEVSDPLERMNRGIFRGNRFLDRVLLDPLARGYRWILPGPVRGAVRGVFENLGSPGVIVNDLLQGEGSRAGDASARFLLNTTVGLAGIWDPATRIGYQAHNSDFGQTLGKAGWETGPYLVLPVFGPNTTRDLVGDVVDLALRPDTWLLPLGSRLVLGSTDGISLKDANLEEINALEASSVDFYTAMRSAYMMDRDAFVLGTDTAARVEPSIDSAPQGRAASSPPLAEPVLLP